MSRLDERFLDELKGRLRLSDVIGRSVKLKRQGREWVGLSPFAKEKTPSFFVNDDKGFFHDFSSGKHGDLIGFLQENERLSFREAVERLAAEAGMQLPADDPRAAEQEARRYGLIEWLEEAGKWFEAQLRRPPGEAARAYLDRRGLGAEVQARFTIGYAPAGRTGLKDHLIAKGARPGDLVDAGLLIAPADGGAPYDRFRDRVIFPITDARGRVVSFGGRALDPAARAKYLNGPETQVFSKGRTLYGLPEARRLLQAAAVAKVEAPLVVVEGYMDAIACHRAEIPAVAGQGTALTEEQMEALWRLHPEPTLCFDGDAAGQRAAHRAMDRALPLLKPGRSFRFAVPTGGKDPDEVLREQGAAVLRTQMAATTPFSEQIFEREMAALDVRNTPEARAAAKARLRTLAGAISDRDLAEQYREELLGRFYELTQRPRFVSRARGATYETTFVTSAQTIKQKIELRIRRFNALVAVGAIHNPEWALSIIEDISRVGFGDERMDAIIQPLIDAISEPNASADSVKNHIRSNGGAVSLQAVYYYAFETKLNLSFELNDSMHAYQVWLSAAQLMIELAYVEVELGERSQFRGDINETHAHSYIDRGRDLRGQFRELRERTMAHEGWPWVNAILESADIDPSEPVRRWREQAEEVVAAQAEAASGAHPIH